ncbi:hypothetical protein LINGRAHAP2_LOCUS2958, partial [Linum grandiflorum]
MWYWKATSIAYNFDEDIESKICVFLVQGRVLTSNGLFRQLFL